MDIIYRQATPDDVVALLSVMDLALGSEDETVAKPDELPARIERWLPRLSDPSVIFWVAEAEGRVVAWTRGQQPIPCHRTAGGVEYEAECVNAFVLPAHQGRGIGKALWRMTWDSTLALLQPKNFIVWSVPGAIGFYKSLGGTESEERAVCDTEPLDQHTAIVWPDVSDSTHKLFGK